MVVVVVAVAVLAVAVGGELQEHLLEAGAVGGPELDEGDAGGQGDPADQGGTVLLSSHLLHEIEVIADDLVVIGHGRIVAQGTKAELLASAGTLVRAGQLAELRRALTARGIHVVPAAEGLRAEADPDQVGEVALAAGVALTELRAADGAGLEEMFLELTAETSREGAAA